MLLASDIRGNKAHGTRSVQGDPRDQIFQAVGLEFLHEALHTRRFKLEDTVTFARCDIGIDIRIIRLHSGDIQHAVFQFRASLPDAASMTREPDPFLFVFGSHPHRVFDHSQCAKAQEVHFQKAQMLHGVLGKLGHQVAVGCAGKRNEVVHIPLTDHDAGCMGGGVPRQAFQLPCHIDQCLDLRIRVIHILQILADLERYIDGHLLC